ncbi:hypothetical protein LUZ60_013730 [Juncus effusus]|nr:hypothetical protein LUZ60_013730 [Juncus effusus]
MKMIVSSSSSSSAQAQTPLCFRKPKSSFQNLAIAKTFHQASCKHGISAHSHSHTQKLRVLIESDRPKEAVDLYGEMKSMGTQPGVVLESMLVNLLMKCNRIDDAFEVFDEMPERNIVTWTSVISGLVRNGLYDFGFSLFCEMLESGIIPNNFSLNAAIKACTGMNSVWSGESLHSLIVKLGLINDIWTGNTLIDFYSKCNLMENAQKVFDEMSELNLVSYTALISGYCNNELFEPAIYLFIQMLRNGIESNEFTITSILTACGPQIGKQIHNYMIKNGISNNIYSSTALIDFYSRNQEFEMAKIIFQNIEERNIVTWCSIISCYVKNNQFDSALKSFISMILEGIIPNEFTFSTALAACGFSPKSIEFGKQLQGLIIKYNFISDLRVINSLIAMYGRIGHVNEFETLFIRVKNRDLVSWSTLVSSYFKAGFELKSVKALCEMHFYGFTPSDYAMSSALSSCANLTILDQGKQFHGLVLKLGFDKGLCGGNALINMYSKCGCINEAKKAFDEMFVHDITSWNSLIHGYANHGDVIKTFEIFNMMVRNGNLQDESTFLAILIACNHGGIVEEAKMYFELMMDYYKIVPTNSHYACMVDLMGRNGRIEEALYMINNMIHEPDISIWKTLLASCKLHGNLEIGKLAVEKIKSLSKNDSASYVLMSNLYSMHGEWDEASRERKYLDKLGLRKTAGFSWIEVKNKVHYFVAKDERHPETDEIYRVLGDLFVIMKDEGQLGHML